MNVRRFFSLTLLCLSMLNQFLMPIDFNGPVDIFSAQFAQLPIVGVNGQGNAVILASAIDNFPFLYEKGSQLITGVPQNFQNFAALGIDQSNHSISVNSAGNAIVVWQEVDPITNKFNFRSAPLLSNIWGAAAVISDPVLVSTQGFFPAGVNITDANNGLSTWVAQKSSDSSFAVQYNTFNGASWGVAQDFYTSPNLLIGTAMAGSPSGSALALWFQNSPLLLQAGFYNGASWNVTNLSSNVFASGIPFAAVAMNKLNDALFVWLDTDGNLISNSFVSGSYGSEQIIYNPEGSEVITNAQVAYDQFGNGFALLIVYIPSIPLYKLLASRYENGAWQQDPVNLYQAVEGQRSISNPSIHVDGQGNATAVWQYNSTNDFAEVYFNSYTLLTNKTKGLGAWDPQATLLSTPGVSSIQPQHSVNNNGDITVVWSIGSLGNQTIQAVFTQGVPPLPPQSFKGEQIRVGPPGNCDLINVLQWTPSLDPTVVSYFLFRDGVKIATIPAAGPYIYENHNRDCREVYVYSITSVNADGLQSTPLFVTLP